MKWKPTKKERCDWETQMTCQKHLNARRGWKSLSEFTGFSTKTLQRHKEELQDAGAIFYCRKWPYLNAPHTKRVAWFPALVMAYYAKLGSSRKVFGERKKAA
jgi:hypothetical protein